MIEELLKLVKCSPFIRFNNFKSMLYNDLPYDEDGKIDIDNCLQNYSYDIKIMNNFENIVWNNEISTIRILVNKKTNIIEDIYYYDHSSDSRMDIIVYPETGIYNYYEEEEEDILS